MVTVIKDIREFFKAHIQCFIGDFRVQAANAHELEVMAEDVRARNGIILSGSSDFDDNYRNTIR